MVAASMVDTTPILPLWLGALQVGNGLHLVEHVLMSKVAVANAEIMDDIGPLPAILDVIIAVPSM